MIRFSAALVAVAVGVLVAGVVTSKLLFVYVAIGVSAAALVALAIGVVLKRAELFGEAGASPGPAAAGASTEEPRLPSQNQVLPNGRGDSPDAPRPAGGSAAFPLGPFPPDAGNSRDAVRAAAQGGQQGSQGTPGFGPPGYGQLQPAFGQGAQGTPSGRESQSGQPQPAFGLAAFGQGPQGTQPGREAQPGQPQPAFGQAARNAPAQDTPAWGHQGREKATPWDTPARDSAAREASSRDAPGREAAARNAPAWDAPPREAPSWQPPQPLGTLRPDAPPPGAPPPVVPPERPAREGRAGDEDRTAGPFRSRDLWGPSTPPAPAAPAAAAS
ncbi:MAG TPA: hypothetical protein VFE26_05735, partial [Trebonia sp.]|nr:hypothetical protein [Trebonia sp.]